MNTELPDLGLEVGDEVEAFGVNGQVHAIDISANRPIVILLKDGVAVNFLRDGRREYWHKIPSLKIIKKAKKKMRVEA